MKTIKKILYATDFSESSVPACDYALTLAKLAKAEVHVLHVIGEFADRRMNMMQPETMTLLEREEAQAMEIQAVKEMEGVLQEEIRRGNILYHRSGDRHPLPGDHQEGRRTVRRPHCRRHPWPHRPGTCHRRQHRRTPGSPLNRAGTHRARQVMVASTIGQDRRIDHLTAGTALPGIKSPHKIVKFLSIHPALALGAFHEATS
jgi:hypothetical protein